MMISISNHYGKNRTQQWQTKYQYFVHIVTQISTQWLSITTMAMKFVDNGCLTYTERCVKTGHLPFHSFSLWWACRLATYHRNSVDQLEHTLKTRCCCPGGWLVRCLSARCSTECYLHHRQAMQNYLKLMWSSTSNKLELLEAKRQDIIRSKSSKMILTLV